MAWETLKSAVSAVITANGNNDITGQILQDLLNNNIIEQLGDTLFKGIATTSTNPGTPEKKVIYLAQNNGVYANFNGIELENEICFLQYDGTQWVKIFINYTSNEVKIQEAYVLKEGKTNLNIFEVGDKFRAWIGDRYVVGKVIDTFAGTFASAVDDNTKISLVIDSEI